MNGIVQIKRDSFGRQDLVRMRTSQRNAKCAWCGQAARFCYGWWKDDGRVGPLSKPMCSVGCYRAYTGDAA